MHTLELKDMLTQSGWKCCKSYSVACVWNWPTSETECRHSLTVEQAWPFDRRLSLLAVPTVWRGHATPATYLLYTKTHTGTHDLVGLIVKLQYLSCLAGRLYGCHQDTRVFFVAQHSGRRTFDQAVAGSTPGWGVMESPRSTQPSIPPR